MLALARGQPDGLGAGGVVEVPPGEPNAVRSLGVQAGGLEVDLAPVEDDGAEADVADPGRVGPEIGPARGDPQQRPALGAVGGVRPAVQVADQVKALGRPFPQSGLLGVAPLSVVLQGPLDGLRRRGLHGLLVDGGGLLGHRLVLGRVHQLAHGRAHGRRVGSHQGPGDREHGRRGLGLHLRVVEELGGHLEGPRVGRLRQRSQEHALRRGGLGGRPDLPEHGQARPGVLQLAHQAQVTPQGQHAVFGAFGGLRDLHKVFCRGHVGPGGQRAHGGVAHGRVGVGQVPAHGRQGLGTGEPAQRLQQQRLRLGRGLHKRGNHRACRLGRAREPGAGSQHGPLRGRRVAGRGRRDQQLDELRVAVGPGHQRERLKRRGAQGLVRAGGRVQQHGRGCRGAPRGQHPEDLDAHGNVARLGQRQQLRLDAIAGHLREAAAGALPDLAAGGGGQRGQRLDDGCVSQPGHGPEGRCAHGLVLGVDACQRSHGRCAVASLGQDAQEPHLPCGVGLLQPADQGVGEPSSRQPDGQPGGGGR